MSSIRVEGLEELFNKLTELERMRCIDEALTKACLMVEADAKINCPVDDGQLRQSITHEIDKQVGAVGTNVHYAPYVHQGTGIYAVNGDGRKTKWSYQDEEGEWHSTIGQHPQPFLENALDANKVRIKEVFKEEIKREVRK